MTPEDQKNVDAFVEAAKAYTRKDVFTPDNAAITRLNKKGFSTSLSTRQDDPMSLAGRVQIGEHTLDIDYPIDETED